MLACFRHRFQMSDPAWQMLTLEGAAALYAATMEMVGGERGGVRPVHAMTRDSRRSPPTSTARLKAIGDFIGRWRRMRDFAAAVAAAACHPSGPQLRAASIEAQLAPARWRGCWRPGWSAAAAEPPR